MAALATQQVTINGTQLTYTAAAGGGDTVTPSDRTFLSVNNAGGSPITVTVVTPGTFAGQPLADVPITVTNGTRKEIGPLTYALADSTGVVPITYSAVTSVTVAAARM